MFQEDKLEMWASFLIITILSALINLWILYFTKNVLNTWLFSIPTAVSLLVLPLTSPPSPGLLIDAKVIFPKHKSEWIIFSLKPLSGFPSS